MPAPPAPAHLPLAAFPTVLRTSAVSTTRANDELMKRTNKRGPDSCIDAVGCEASGHGSADAVLDKVKATAFLATDRVHVLRQAIMCCRKAGRV